MKLNKIIVNTVYFIFLIVFVYLTFFYFKENKSTVLSQIINPNDGINSISLEVYPRANYQNLGSSTSIGITTNINGDEFAKLYNISPYVTALDKSFYKLTIPAITNINLKFERIYPSSSPRLLNSTSCVSLNGNIQGSNCVIYGMLTRTTSTEYEHWLISASSSRGGQSLGQINFYLVSSSTALNPNNNQYYLIPIATSVTLTNSNPSAKIPYQIYYKKIYCPNNLVEGEATISPTTTGFDRPLFNNIRNSDYQLNNIFVVRNLNIYNNALSGDYRLYLKKFQTDNTIISNFASITINNNITPPTLSLSCNAIPASGLRINSSTTYILTASSSQQLVNATFTLLIATSGGQYLRFNTSAIINSISGSVTTSVTWTASGTYYATATVLALNTTTSAQCPTVSVEECNCLYRQTTGGIERSCRRADGSWGAWEPYQGQIDSSYCNCNDPSIRNRYRRCNE
ncbi:MAG: hypothetical protein KatS3mg094_282 [Candidatus Parcubacteria bacterium]|nr:MAG: hypothetical protein KatS3mg094_282 [Candidatus Parcubacteria bacterium]